MTVYTVLRPLCAAYFHIITWIEKIVNEKYDLGLKKECRLGDRELFGIFYHKTILWLTVTARLPGPMWQPTTRDSGSPVIS